MKIYDVSETRWGGRQFLMLQSARKKIRFLNSVSLGCNGFEFSSFCNEVLEQVVAHI